MSFDDQQTEWLRDQNARYLDYLRDLEWWRYLDWLRDQANQQRLDELRNQANQLQLDDVHDRDPALATAVDQQGRQAPGSPPGDVRLVQPVAFEQLTDEQLQELDTLATDHHASGNDPDHDVQPVLPTAFEQLSDEELHALDAFATWEAANPFSLPLPSPAGRPPAGLWADTRSPPNGCRPSAWRRSTRSCRRPSPPCTARTAPRSGFGSRSSIPTPSPRFVTGSAGETSPARTPSR